MIHLYVTYRPMVLDRMRPDVGTFSCASAHCINLRICFGFSIGVNSAITSGASDGFELCRVFKQIIDQPDSSDFKSKQAEFCRFPNI